MLGLETPDYFFVLYPLAIVALILLFAANTD